MDSLHTSLVDDGGPMIPRTKSLYELPKRGSVDYRFRNTVAFWIAVSFVEGSLLFMCGAIASIGGVLLGLDFARMRASARVGVFAREGPRGRRA